jgi:hypothetical protein
VVEHATKAAAEMLNSLKGSPTLLALIMLNMMMGAGALWFLKTLAEAQQARFDLLMKMCGGKL